MILREYQKDLVRQIYESWQRGNKNVGVQLHTGGGKTCIFSYILAHHPGGAIAIAHRVELVSQISLTLARYNIAHNIIAQKQSIREIIALHHDEVGRSFYKSTSNIVVAGIDTLLRLSADTPWFKSISLVVQDEGHHPLKKNKWGRAAELFSNAYGLYPTATPCRADGNGLGRHSDGILDDLIVGIPMRQLIHDGFLTDYRIFAPPNDLDLSNVPVGSTGDFSFDPLRKAVHKSQITGDIVKHYLKIAPGKLGVTFAVDVDAAVEIKTAFCAAGIKAELITGKTPATLRANIMRRFRNEEIKQIVNVDILGEGVDVPAIEVVSMARPTESYGLYSQSFGRALRPKNSKKHALIIDHVGNVLRHGLPDAPRIWTLDRREKRSRSKQNDEILLISCVECFSVYKRVLRSCPFCDYVPVPTNRSAPEYVDGDLNELSVRY